MNDQYKCSYSVNYEYELTAMFLIYIQFLQFI